MKKLIEIYLLLMFFLRIITEGAVIPKIDLKNSDSNFRGNFCPELFAFLNKSVSLESALKGRVITIGINPPSASNAFYMKVNASSGLPNGGFMYRVQDMLASQGGFTIKYVQVPTRGTDDFVTFFTKICPRIDFYGPSWYADTVDRRIRRIGFTNNIVDASLYLVTTQTIKSEYNLWSFTAPFSNELWGLIVVILFFNSIISWMFRNADSGDESDVPYIEYLFFSFLSFTTIDSSQERCKNSKSMVLNLGLCFWVLVLGASYTANLASVLIANSMPVAGLIDIEDANLKGALICVEGGSMSESVLSTSYPKIKRFASTDPALSLAKGLCTGAILSANAWDIAQTRKLQNPNCNMVQVGSVIRVVSGAWAFQLDYTDKCTSFVNEVFSALFLGLRATGAIESLWKDQLAASTDKECPIVEAESTALGIKNMAGIFIIYVIFVGFSSLIHVYDVIRAKWFPDKRPPEESYTTPDQQQQETLEMTDIGGRKEEAI